MLQLEGTDLQGTRVQHAPTTIRKLVTHSRDNYDPREVNTDAQQSRKHGHANITTHEELEDFVVEK